MFPGYISHPINKYPHLLRVFPTILKSNPELTYPQLHESFCAKNPKLSFTSTGLPMKWYIRVVSFLALNRGLQSSPISLIEEADYTPRSPHYNYFSENLYKKYGLLILADFRLRGANGRERLLPRPLKATSIQASTLTPCRNSRFSRAHRR